MKNLLCKKSYFLTVSIISLLAISLRTLTLYANIDPSTGFYKSRSAADRVLLLILLAAALLFGICWQFVLKRRAVLPVNLNYDFAPLANQRPLFAMMTVGFAVNTFYEIFRLANPMPTDNPNANITLFAVMTTLLSAASLIFFLMLSFLIENQHIGQSGLCLVIAAWVIFRILRDFVSFTTLFYISKNLLDILYLCMLLISILSAARVFSDVDRKKGLRLFHIVTPITIVLGFVLSIPAIFCFVCGSESVGGSDVFMHFVDLTLSVFLFRCALFFYREA